MAIYKAGQNLIGLSFRPAGEILLLKLCLGNFISSDHLILKILPVGQSDSVCKANLQTSKSRVTGDRLTVI